MSIFACFRWLFWRTLHTLKLLNQVRPVSPDFRELDDSNYRVHYDRETVRTIRTHIKIFTKVHKACSSSPNFECQNKDPLQ